jgi:hypothetical protein
VLPTLHQHTLQQNDRRLYTLSLASFSCLHILSRDDDRRVATCSVCNSDCYNDSVTYWVITVSPYLTLYRSHRFSSSSFMTSFCCFTSSCYYQYSSIYFLSYNCPPSCPHSLSSPPPLFFQFIISFINLPFPPASHSLTVACNRVLYCTALHTNNYTNPNPLRFAIYKLPPLVATTKQSQF